MDGEFSVEVLAEHSPRRAAPERRLVGDPRAFKVAIDFCLVTVALLVLLPILAAIALLVGLDGGPVFYAHPRIGRFGRAFSCYKFRSMSVHADKILNDLLKFDSESAAEWATTRKLKCDPRVTRVGAVLRRTSLDELPQLLNVLRLEMSLVGPRPIVHEETFLYEDNITYYYDVRPGITGLWQVSGRSETSYAERVELDTWYVRNWSLWLDFEILVRTIPAVLFRTGAC